MSAMRKRWLPAVAALAVAAALGASPAVASSTAAASPAPHAPARHAASAADPTITILTGGDRTSSSPGSAANTTGGSVDGVAGVTYTATGPGGTASCVSTTTDCVITVDTGGTYTVTQVSGPSGSNVAHDDYFVNQFLGTGTAGGIITEERYNTLTVSVPASGNVTIPMGSAALTPLTVRSSRWAVSRYNAPPPPTCTRSVALLFDLSGSITPPFLADYKAAAIGYVRSLESSSTDVTLYTFGTAAPAPGAGDAAFGPVNTSTAEGVATLVARIHGLTLPTPAQYTNWDAGMWQMTTTAAMPAPHRPYNEAIVLTDGDPTAMGSTGSPDATGTAITRFRSVEAGIFSANALKSEGTRVIAVGLEARHQPGSVDNLIAISGPHNRSDYFLIPFDELESTLEDVALADCATLSITKEADTDTYTHVGQVITYTYVVTNTSPTDGFELRDVAIHDDTIPGPFTCSPVSIGGTLQPGESTTCTATHTVTQADMDRGEIRNTAHATGDTPNGSEVESLPDDEDVTALQEPHITVTKSATPEVFTEGTTLTYSYTVRNTGNVTLHNVTVHDDLLGTIACTPTTLAPGAAATCPTATHIATAADVAAGRIHNNVTATGTTDTGRMVTDEAERTVFPRTTPAIRVTKSVSPEVFTQGTTLTYSFTVTNTGDVTLTGVTVHDDVLGTIACTPTTLAPGASATCPTATHVATAADVAAGRIHNTVTATGTPPQGGTVRDEAERTVFPSIAPAIRVTKSVSPATFTEGTTLTYSFTVTNIGDVTLHNVTVRDDLLGTIACTPTTLAPGASATCPTATHVATAADVAAGRIHNNVTATGTAPDGAMVTDEAERTVFPSIAPAIRVTKTATPQEFTRPGQVITYHFTVTNIGDVTLTGVTVHDDVLGTIACTPTTLAPGASATCPTATHTTTQADVDAGRIHDNVTGTGTGPDGQQVTDEDEQTVTAGFAPEIEITKTANPTVYSMHGEVITYTYVVSNTGNVTLHGIVLTDTRYGTITCPRSTLAPGESMTCHNTHAISAVDLDEGSIFNSASATGHPPSGGPVESEPKHAIVKGVRAPTPPPPTVPVTG